MRPISRIAATVAVAAALVFTGGTAAQADSEYDVTISRADVAAQAGIFDAIGFVCSFAPWYVSPGCGGGDAATVFDYAALKGCAIRQHVVITDTVYSWDNSVSTYYPYLCNNPNG